MCTASRSNSQCRHLKRFSTRLLSQLGICGSVRWRCDIREHLRSIDLSRCSFLLAPAACAPAISLRVTLLSYTALSRTTGLQSPLTSVTRLTSA